MTDDWDQSTRLFHNSLCICSQSSVINDQSSSWRRDPTCDTAFCLSGETLAICDELTRQFQRRLRRSFISSACLQILKSVPEIAPGAARLAGQNKQVFELPQRL